MTHSIDCIPAVTVSLRHATSILREEDRPSARHVTDEDIENARKAGIDDGLMMEVVANVAVNTLTNYANELAGTEIDFPVVEVKL
jgi:hypothetical protein